MVIAAATNVDLSRVQFATTSIYHFIFVPITIGLAFLVAILQTMWHRSGNAEHRQLARFFGTLLLINVAIGVVTGLVQEFEFGMNWSAYSRFVGDVFGAPLAMEGLAAFFLESTFLGLWIFGWDRLPKRIHLACIWLVAFGAMLSAAFIMAANSWMQHPVGYTINSTTGRPELNDIGALFTNPVFLWGYAHVILASLVVGSTIMLGVSAWHLRRDPDTPFARSARTSLVVLVPSMILVLWVGGNLGVIETKYQPMKVAAMEAQWNTCQPCSFSVIQVGGGNNDQTPTKIIAIPHLLSVLATNSWNGQVVGINQLNAQYQQQYGPGSYIPNIFVQYWSMRVMAYLGSLMFLFALWGAWLAWRHKLERSRFFLLLATWSVIVPFLMTTAGWLLTENGRQPWIVQGLMLTRNGVSSSVSSTMVWFSLSALIAIFVIMGIVDGVLMTKFARRDITTDEGEEPDARADAEKVLAY
jgi:cytochrome bd ubiquinol oxidase subunit I